MRVPQGLLLPESVLSSWWFITLALIVAFNTIIYLGLTLSKLVPWPHQFHPARVRGWLLRLGANVDGDPRLTDVPLPRAPESTDPYESLRGGIARRDIPQAFGLFGILVIVITTVVLIVNQGQNLWVSVVQLTLGVAFLLLANITGRRHYRAVTVEWIWVVACTVLVIALLVEAARSGRLAAVAYSLMLMTAFAPVTLAWRPALVGSGVMLAGLVAAASSSGALDTARIIIAGASALLVGLVLLRLRFVAADALADERARSAALATTDPLTGSLTRSGLLSLVPMVAGLAERTTGTVCVIAVDILHLSEATATYGVRYRDDILRTLATTLHDSVRLGDLVARWSGDDFVVVGVGGRPDALAMQQRLQAALDTSGVSLGKAPVRIVVGTAAGSPRERTFEELLADASEGLALD
jgi:diguanylate cyclase (GGDEF)-like protein